MPLFLQSASYKFKGYRKSTFNCSAIADKMNSCKFVFHGQAMKVIYLLAVCCVGLMFLTDQSKAADWPEGVIGGLQHAGAVHFYAQPGMLNITLYKRDSAGTSTADRTMKAFLYGPDGTIYDNAILPSQKITTGQAGPLQHQQLQAKIDRAGVYTLLVTMNQDQYVRLVSWGFATNARQFVINANTGHTDHQRQETIMLNGEMQPFSIFFKPPHRSFNLDITRLPESAHQVEMYDASGKLLQAVPVKDGAAKSTFDATTATAEDVWELRLPVQRGTILMDGFNQNWEKDETILPVWSTSREHYFDLSNYFWLLEPRRFARQVKAGDSGTIDVSVYNHSSKPMPLKLQVEDVPARIIAEATP